MSTKKEAHFSFEECSCAEMMAQMMPQSKWRKRAGGTCTKMMSQMMILYCDAEQESQETVSKA